MPVMFLHITAISIIQVHQKVWKSMPSWKVSSNYGTNGIVGVENITTDDDTTLHANLWHIYKELTNVGLVGKYN